jgi:hypothetical protein
MLSPPSPDTKYLSRLKDIEVNPIFIMGDHRSGTTFLYQILAQTQAFNYVNTYHVLRYSEILSNFIHKREKNAYQDIIDTFAELNLQDRVFDKVKITPELPEEYGFILSNYSKQACLDHDNLNFFYEMCKKIQYISSDPTIPLLLKNPWCYRRFLLVSEIFPESKFIFIHRNPVDVINSKLKAVRVLFSRKNMHTYLVSRSYRKMADNPLVFQALNLYYSNPMNLGLNKLIESTQSICNYYSKNIVFLPKANYLSITYEALCDDPNSCVCKILDFLGLTSQSNTDYSKQTQLLGKELLPEVARLKLRIERKIQPYLHLLGYAQTK